MGVSKAQAKKVLDDFRKNLCIGSPGKEPAKPTELILVGSFRRGHERSDDIDLLAITRHIRPDVRVSLKPGGKYSIHKYGGKDRHIMLKIRAQHHGDKPDGLIPVDIFVTGPEEKPFALYHYTGSKRYNIRTRKKAKDAGYRLNQYGLFVNDRKSPGLRSERDIARRIGVRYRTPADRET